MREYKSLPLRGLLIPPSHPFSATLPTPQTSTMAPIRASLAICLLMLLAATAVEGKAWYYRKCPGGDYARFVSVLAGAPRARNGGMCGSRVAPALCWGLGPPTPGSA